MFPCPVTIILRILGFNAAILGSASIPDIPPKRKSIMATPSSTLGTTARNSSAHLKVDTEKPRARRSDSGKSVSLGYRQSQTPGIPPTQQRTLALGIDFSKKLGRLLGDTGLILPTERDECGSFLLILSSASPLERFASSLRRKAVAGERCKCRVVSRSLNIGPVKRPTHRTSTRLGNAQKRLQRKISRWRKARQSDRKDAQRQIEYPVFTDDSRP